MASRWCYRVKKIESISLWCKVRWTAESSFQRICFQVIAVNSFALHPSHFLTCSHCRYSTAYSQVILGDSLLTQGLSTEHGSVRGLLGSTVSCCNMMLMPRIPHLSPTPICQMAHSLAATSALIYIYIL